MRASRKILFDFLRGPYTPLPAFHWGGRDNFYLFIEAETGCCYKPDIAPVFGLCYLAFFSLKGPFAIL